MTGDAPRPFRARAFIALVMAVGLALMATSGLILAGAPHCGVARNLAWRAAGLTKDQWSAIHLNAALVFIATGLCHLCYNLKPLLAYLRRRAGGPRRLRLEAVYALLLGLLLIFGPATGMPPFRQIVDLGARLAASWAEPVP